jgi:hypothetical protein
VSIRGLDQRNDQPPAGWPTHEQTIWNHPWDDGLEDYSSGVTGVSRH